MKLSRTALYAVRATLQLAQVGSSRPVPCSQLANEGKMPERFLLQVLRSLVTHGILRSTRGVEGGYQLQKPAEEVSLLEVIEAVEGPLASAPVEGAEMADAARQQLMQALEQVAEQSRDLLSRLTFDLLLNQPSDL